MEYNTSRNYLVMKEYGRHIQRMIEYILTIEDREKRQQQAMVAIELMGFLNPHLKNVEDFRHKLWDHLFFISDFKLDVDSPYPIPTKETYKEKPGPLPYPKRHPKFSHLGKNIELVIDKALNEENPEKKNGLANAVAYYMKLAYNNWHKESVADEAIQAELNNLTRGQLEFTNTPSVKAFRNNDNRGNDNRNYNDFRNKRNQKFVHAMEEIIGAETTTEVAVETGIWISEAWTIVILSSETKKDINNKKAGFAGFFMPVAFSYL